MNDSMGQPRRGTGRFEGNQGRGGIYGGGSPGIRMVDRRKPERRALFLAEISRLLPESFDQEEILLSVAKLAMPELNAWSVVDLIDADGAIRRLSVSHPNESLQPLAEELSMEYAPAPMDTFGAPRIVATKEPELVSEIANATLEATAHDKRHHEILRTLGFCSFMVLPLKARGRLLGAITFIGADGEQRYTPKDLLFAEDLAGRAAMAMDNARLYQEAQQAREEAVAAVARAAIADRAKTDFLATMSHELRTPLNAIAGYAELLQLGMRGPVTDQQQEAISRIRSSQHHLLGIVNDILTFAKTETGRIPINLENSPVTPAINAVRFLVEPLLLQNEIQYSFDECSAETSVVADRERLQQILVNLLTNAAKFSPRGGEVNIRCEVREHLVAIIVEDKGKGIEVDMLEAIFEPFVQISTGLTRTADGSGLGLAISRELARLMGGDVTVESDAGAGSSFTLTLPMSPPSVPVL